MSQYSDDAPAIYALVGIFVVFSLALVAMVHKYPPAGPSECARGQMQPVVELLGFHYRTAYVKVADDSIVRLNQPHDMVVGAEVCATPRNTVDSVPFSG